MRLTSKGRYAVMAMADLALHSGRERAVPLQDVASRQEISLSYLEQLFAEPSSQRVALIGSFTAAMMSAMVTALAARDSR